MPKKCKNPLLRVTATIAYYMELNNLNNLEICKRLNISKSAWYDKKKSPGKFTLDELSGISRILGIGIDTLVTGLVPKETERSG